MNKQHSTPTQLNRMYAIAGYLLYVFFFLLAMIECIADDVLFHIPMFAFFILAYCVGAYTALRYNLLIEMRVLYVGMVIASVCVIANFAVMHRFDLAFVTRTIIIMCLNIVWFAHRLQNIRWLYNETEKFLKEQKEQGEAK